MFIHYKNFERKYVLDQMTIETINFILDKISSAGS